MNNDRKTEILRKGLEINDELKAILDEIGYDEQMMKCLHETVKPSMLRIINVIVKDEMKFLMDMKNINRQNGRD